MNPIANAAEARNVLANIRDVASRFAGREIPSYVMIDHTANLAALATWKLSASKRSLRAAGF